MDGDLPDLAPGSPGAPRLTLARQFLLAGGAVVLLAALLIGAAVSARIEKVVVRSSAVATALYLESFLSPLGPDLASDEPLSPGALQALEEVFTGPPLADQVASYKLWRQGGVVAHASDPGLIGQVFPPSPELQAAWAGQVAGDFAPEPAAESASALASGTPLLEIYVPLRADWSGDVLAVAEVYMKAEDLAQDLSQARLLSWAAVAGALLAIGGLLFAIVARGSRTIEGQRARLSAQVEKLAALSAENGALRQRAVRAAGRAAARQERALRQAGADLHDGPAQLLGFAALRLDGLGAHLKTAPAKAALAEVGKALREALTDLRAIARGLALPDIEKREIGALITGLVEAHAARTGGKVALDIAPDAAMMPLSAAAKIGLYRAVQEGLSNGWRHGQGQGQRIGLWRAGREIILEMSDEGPGFPPAPSAKDGAAGVPDEAAPGMGLAALRDRVEALGGKFEAFNRPPSAQRPGGAHLRLRLEGEKTV